MNQLLQDCLNQVNPDTREEVRKNMTMTQELDTRARAFAKKQCDKYGDEEEIFSFYYNEYLEIGRMEIIYKATEWLKARNVLTDASLEGFCKAMEE